MCGRRGRIVGGEGGLRAAYAISTNKNIKVEVPLQHAPQISWELLKYLVVCVPRRSHDLVVLQAPQCPGGERGVLPCASKPDLTGTTFLLQHQCMTAPHLYKEYFQGEWLLVLSRLYLHPNQKIMPCAHLGGPHYPAGVPADEGIKFAAVMRT